MGGRKRDRSRHLVTEDDRRRDRVLNERNEAFKQQSAALAGQQAEERRQKGAEIFRLAMEGSDLVSPKAAQALKDAVARLRSVAAARSVLAIRAGRANDGVDSEATSDAGPRAHLRRQLEGAKDAFRLALAGVEESVRIRQEIAFRRAAAANSTLPSARVRPLSWQVLPPGAWKRANFGMRVDAAQTVVRRFEPKRLQLLDGLGPSAWYSGSHLGQTVYLVAVFERVAVADTPDWGNALYYCPVANGRWQTVFQLEKRAAIAAGATRITHTDGWESQVRRLIAIGR